MRTSRAIYGPTFAQYGDDDIPLSEWEFDCAMSFASNKGRHATFPSMAPGNSYRSERAAWYALIVWTYGQECLDDIGSFSPAMEMEIAEAIADIEFIHSDAFFNVQHYTD